MTKRLTVPKKLPCILCGSAPEVRSVDHHFRPTGNFLFGDYLFTAIEIRCSNPKCSKEHRHFGAYPTRREAILRWNARNKKT